MSALHAILQKDPVREAHAKSRKELIAFADPLENSATSIDANQPQLRSWASSFSALPYAAQEIQQISTLYPPDKTTILVGKEATESKAKRLELDKFRTVHFASHAFIDETRPSLSALLLNPGGSEEDGFLTMREVFDLKLNADLVVLSACKSGLGKQVRGEGVTGLARAFFCAGSFEPSCEFMECERQIDIGVHDGFLQNSQTKPHVKTGSPESDAVEVYSSSAIQPPLFLGAFHPYRPRVSP